MFNPRPNQAEILNYRSGWMGISAVPGSGKTHTLSYLAAKLITSGMIDNDQEILIVTLVNSAVDNFKTRIAGFAKEAGLLENVGYRVRTLHGLAHDIVRERPDLAGVSEQFSIVDETEVNRMIETLSTSYLREHPEIEVHLVKPDFDLKSDYQAGKKWLEMIASLNQNFIRLAKDYTSEPEDILSKLKSFKYSDPILEMAIEVYAQYQRGLRYRNAVDFSDLIRLAYIAINADPDFLSRLRHRWPYVLEDEAQDSSQIQENILRMLVGVDGNWVRVGDPNQAIYESFTTASPRFLRQFLEEPGVDKKSLPNSGRSNKSIMDLANSLIKWTRTLHPVEKLRDALAEPYVLSTPPGDPQPNPPDSPNAVYVSTRKFGSDAEIRVVVDSIKKWLPDNRDKTVAVLCPIGFHGEKVVEALQITGINVVELLGSSQSTRKTSRVIEKILFSLAAPSSVNKFSDSVKEILHLDPEKEKEIDEEIKELTSLLKKIRNLEDFFYPQPGTDWKTLFTMENCSEYLTQKLVSIRLNFIRWHAATLLPVDQLVLTIAQDLFSKPADLALAHKLALLLEFSAKIHPANQLNEFAIELKDISSNTRKFSGFSDEENTFNPDDHKGEVFVSTFHKSKGLEWDRVYLISVNNYDFPSAQEFDAYKGEKWFIRDSLNPEAEALSKLEALVKDDVSQLLSPEKQATIEAREEYSSERLRLLYVGITRARESLYISWNTGKKESHAALPLEALHALWEQRNANP